MKQQNRQTSKPSKTSDDIARTRNFTLLELLDRLLDKGVVVKGEVLLSVADIDLVYLNLGLLLSSVKSIEQAASRGNNAEAIHSPWHTPISEVFLEEPQPLLRGDDGVLAPLHQENSQDEAQALARRDDEVLAPSPRCEGGQEELLARALPAIDNGLGQLFGPKANIDPKNIEKGLAKLVLTLVDLLRKLMEKQAIRRVEAGQLNVVEVEKMGNAFFLLDEKMEQLKELFGLKDEELNLDLGPLGELL
jgi:hypothetical protein